ncbi:MAG: response regulator [Candidatus Omnitrophota bacterium]|nr:response regulator [Candidatus Omnitrophota bacterium]
MARKKILLVDDEEDIIKMNMLRLSESNYHVISASDGKDGIEKAEKETPDLILLDVVMPGMDGLETLTRLKSNPRTSHIPVIMLSGVGQKTALDKALSSGAIDFIDKPFNGEMLMEAIKKNLPAA